ncbi:STAS/SEC14 domain-containing protein [Mangrovivirga sp. M17]|uniref:STAS/SEC14 domain-containing protein n=1 Tax=Mangrovivirga halotolerans TaxID=2993936 RepID=A0ABT3RQ55_9BACT|nr:STAS/SEC14 domain-containing protein [Mangrovivirga halotolerans]MCX2743914.1 STAS/SEC14 domain-containing protein [Mangrovivirga halotolerans]
MGEVSNKAITSEISPGIIDFRENSKIKFTLYEDGIFETECFPDTVMTYEDGLESTRITSEILGKIPKPLLCDLSNVISMSKECRKHFAGEDHAKTFTKCALIVTKPIGKMIGNFFLGLNKPLKPTRIFLDRKKAIEWLKESD